MDQSDSAAAVLGERFAAVRVLLGRLGYELHELNGALLVVRAGKPRELKGVAAAFAYATGMGAAS